VTRMADTNRAVLTTADRVLIAEAAVRRGRLKLRDRSRFRAELADWSDGAVVVRLERRRATRSLEQNRWYWAVIVELLSETTGYTPDEMHEFLKQKFTPKRIAVCDRNGEIRDERVIGATTTTLTTHEFGEYCESIRRWAAEALGLVIPDPEPVAQ
jgi:hypothetical protein